MSIATQDLPHDIVEVIFRHGCMSSKEFAQTLCGVSSWTRRLAGPFRFSTITFKTLASVTSFEVAVRPSIDDTHDFHPARFLVQKLWIGPVINRVGAIYRHCPNLEYLSIHEENFQWLLRAAFFEVQTQTQTQTTPPLLPPNNNGNKNFHLWFIRGRNLGFSMYSDTFQTSHPSPLFSRITHLRLDTGYGVLKSIQNFTRLSHLAIVYDTSPRHHLHSLLVEMLQLQFVPNLKEFVIIMLVDNINTMMRQSRILSWIKSLKFPKKVRVLASREGNMQKEWQEEVLFGNSIWKKAEIHTKETLDTRVGVNHNVV